MKKICAILLCLVLLASFFACAQQPKQPEKTRPVEQTYPGFPEAPETFAGMDEAELLPYFELAREAYKRYILAVWFPEGKPKLPQFPMQMTPPLRKYTQLRFDDDTLRQQGFPKRFRSITSGAHESWEIIEGKLLCTAFVEVRYLYKTYSRSGMDTASGFDASAQMLIEDPRNPTLVDWFDLDKFSWDRQMRAGHQDLPKDATPAEVMQWHASWNLSDPENWLGRCDMLMGAEKIFD